MAVEKLNAFYGKAQALTEIDVRVEESEFIAIVGANGGGKSTLLDSIIGLSKTTGSIKLDGKELAGKSSPTIVKVSVGYAPKRFNLFPYMTLRDNLIVGAYTARRHMDCTIDIVHQLFPRLEEREGQETSTQLGGERQMVSLWRALMPSPRLLLVDESTIGLAPKVCLEITHALRRMRDEFGTTIVVTEQNVNFAITLVERLYVSEAGHVKVSGTADELGDDPKLTEAYFSH